MIGELNPGLILIVGALLIPLMPQILRGPVSLALPALGLMHLLNLPYGEFGAVTVFGLDLVTLRIDKLSYVFGLIFLAAAFLSAVYSLHVKGWLEAMTAQMYAGSAVGAVFAGDLVTLFVFWEITAITSVFLIWARGTQAAFDTGMRYLLIQVGSGVILLAGVMMHAHANAGDVSFGPIAKITMDGDWSAVPLGAWLILLGIGIKAAFPLLHSWLPDAYPEATVTGTVWLSAFTTKLAIYALARGFPGSDILIPIGAAMALFTLVYAAIEDDLRRALSYALNNQLGFMVIGVGVGSELAINGTAAQAVAHILYKGLFFMTMGAVLLRAGTVKVSELGGLRQTMPMTAAFCVIAALAISTPLFAGFVTKSLILSATAKAGYDWAWGVLIFASAGIFLVTGLRVPYAAFFAPGRGLKAQEAPTNMLAAMALASVLAVAIGVMPGQLYALLPYAVKYDAYTLEHVVTQMQLLLFTGLAFWLALRYGLYPRPAITTDFDWTYRKIGYDFGATVLLLLGELWRLVSGAAKHGVNVAEASISRTHNPDGVLGRTWSTGTMAFWAIAMLAGYLVLFYFRYLPT